jgi:hypothetical protein
MGRSGMCATKQNLPSNQRVVLVPVKALPSSTSRLSHILALHEAAESGGTGETDTCPPSTDIGGLETSIFWERISRDVMFGL